MRRITKIFSIALYIALMIFLGAASVLFFGKMDETVEGFGLVNPGVQREVAPRISGIVSRVYVEEGERVSEGDTLFTIDSEEVEFDVRRAENALVQARSALERSEDEYENLTSTRSYELGVILADLNEAEENREYYRKNFERVKELHEKGLVDAQEFERQRLQYESSKSYYNVLKSRSRILKTQLKRQIEERRRDLGLAERSYQLAQKRLKNTVVTSPINGVIMTPQPDDLEGTMVNRGQQAINIASFDDYMFTVDINETDITEVYKGQEAKIFINSYPHREYKVFRGEVKRIASVPRIQGRQALFEVNVRINQPWVEDENGERVKLKYGLMGRAEVIVKPSVRLYKILFDAISK
jgi:multidrug resistance efflux pump